VTRDEEQDVYCFGRSAPHHSQMPERVFKAAHSRRVVIEPATSDIVSLRRDGRCTQRGQSKQRNFRVQNCTRAESALESADCVAGGVLSVKNFPALWFH
jgi:hypothetical protein